MQSLESCERSDVLSTPKKVASCTSVASQVSIESSENKRQGQGVFNVFGQRLESRPVAAQRGNVWSLARGLEGCDYGSMRMEVGSTQTLCSSV